MREANDIRADITATAEGIEANDREGVYLRKRMGALLAEARAHPELTLEAARQIPEKSIPRQTAYELMRGC